MSSPKLRNCIQSALNAGRITTDQADVLLHRLQEHTAELAGDAQVPRSEDLAKGAWATLNEVDAERRRDMVNMARQTIVTRRLVAQVKSHPKGIATGIFSLIGQDITRRAKYSNVERRAHAILRGMHASWSEALESLRSTHFGLMQDHDTMRLVVRELFGEKTGNAHAARFAKAWQQVSERARERFNQAGGEIGKLKNWGMPQTHDRLRLRRAGVQPWINHVWPLLDRKKMTGELGTPMSDKTLQEHLRKVYQDIVTDGLSELEPGRMRIPRQLADRRREHRHLFFKDGEAWLKYHDRFGSQNLFATMTGHLDGMANDIAMLEIFGPNPRASYLYLRDVARRDSGLEGAKLAVMDATWNTASRKADDSASVFWGDFFAAARNYMSASRLGSAALSAVSDQAFLNHTARWTGLSGVRAMRRFLQQLNPANAADRRFAVRAGLGAEAWASIASTANRFTEVTGAGFSARAADFTMRATGLQAMTDAGRKAFGMELMGTLGEMRSVKFDQLNERLQASLVHYGITPDDWDVLRATTPAVHRGEAFFSIENLARRDDVDAGTRQALLNKVLEMVDELTTFAVPEPGVRARAFTTGGRQRGTIPGEVLRFTMQFKSFPVSVVLTHFYRAFYEAAPRNRAAYAAQLIIGTTMMGALASQLKEISKGRDARPMTTKAFWGAAFMQGGGAGIFGDFLYTGLFGANRYNQNLLTTMAGPTAGLVNDLVKATAGNVGEGLAGEETNAADELIRLAGRSVPFASSAWYTRLAFSRLITEQLQETANPRARASFRRQETRRRRDTGQRYWWRPGAALPSRPPELAEDPP